jgi:hypothetical protein
MIRFLAGIVFGIMIATVGLTGVIGVIEGGVNKIQEVSKDLADK